MTKGKITKILSLCYLNCADESRTTIVKRFVGTPVLEQQKKSRRRTSDLTGIIRGWKGGGGGPGGGAKPPEVVPIRSCSRDAVVLAMKSILEISLKIRKFCIINFLPLVLPILSFMQFYCAIELVNGVVGGGSVGWGVPIGIFMGG